jgi:hypothetical protein
MILPRQARDKHRENSKKSPFCDQLPRGRLLLLYNSSAAHHGLVYPRGALQRVAVAGGSRRLLLGEPPIKWTVHDRWKHLIYF